MKSTRCPGPQRTSLPMYAILRLGCMVDNSDLTMHGRARGEGDSVTEALPHVPSSVSSVSFGITNTWEKPF